MSFRDVVRYLQTGFQRLFSERLSSGLKKRPRVSEEPAEYTTQTVSSLSASTVKHGCTATALFEVIVLVRGPTRFATKVSPHCKRYGSLRSLKCNITTTFPYSNGMG